MPSPAQTEVYKQHRPGQEKYVYFLLTAAASAIALAVQQTSGATLHWSQIPLAIAILFWGVSFVAGCRSVGRALLTLYTNLGMLTAQDGEHPLVQKFGNSDEAIRLVAEESHKIMEQHGSAAAYWTNLQFAMLICGALFYLVWHVLEMAMR